MQMNAMNVRAARGSLDSFCRSLTEIGTVVEKRNREGGLFKYCLVLKTPSEEMKGQIDMQCSQMIEDGF